MGPWLTTIGLLLDIVGVVILARGVIVTNEPGQGARRNTMEWQHGA